MKIQHGSKGFHFTSEAGYVLSVQYGAGNYCSNKNIDFQTTGADVPETEDCEIAVWLEDGSGRSPFLKLGNDNVAGYVPIALIPQIMVDIQRGDIDSIRKRLFVDAEA